MASLVQVWRQDTPPALASVGDFWIRINGRTELCTGIGVNGSPEFTPLGPAKGLETPVAPVQATCVLTSNNTDVADGDTIVINGVTYTFVNTLGSNLDVHRTGTADTTLGNLAKIIMDNGVPDTDYQITSGAGDGTAARGDVTSSTVGTPGAHKITLTLTDQPGQRGTQGNDLTTPDVSDITAARITASDWAGGVDGTTGEVGTITTDDSYLYVCVGANGEWKKASLSAL